MVCQRLYTQLMVPMVWEKSNCKALLDRGFEVDGILFGTDHGLQSRSCLGYPFS